MIIGWSPFKIVSVSAVLYPRWPPLLKIEISSNGQNCSILSQKVPKFRFFFQFHPPFFLFLAWRPSWLEVGITEHKFGRGPSKDRSTKVWLQLAQWFPNDSWVVLFQKCVRHFSTPTKMATTAELNLT
jgi:hypothetical protein